MRVLLVEDNRPLAETLQRGFEEGGLAVDLAADGEEADHKARSIAYDAIVLDLMLPKKDGLTLLKGWRAAGMKAHVLVLTARAEVPDRVLGLNAGADDYLTKPFEFPELLARVRALIRRGHDVKTPVLRVQDLAIDTTDRTVCRSGRIIHLTPREYALLELLAFHVGKVVPREAIWEHLWDEHDESVSNVVDVYIRTLRLKVDKDFFPPLIITRWGQGYMLRGDEPAATSR
jgi:two-component system, OmpR family, response regulator